MMRVAGAWRRIVSAMVLKESWSIPHLAECLALIRKRKRNSIIVMLKLLEELAGDEMIDQETVARIRSDPWAREEAMRSLERQIMRILLKALEPDKYLEKGVDDERSGCS